MNGDTHAQEPRWLTDICGDGSRRLIESRSRVIKVPAGPGAGKTTCLKRRVLRIVDTGEASRPEIFIGTFTRVITRALQEAFARPTGGNPNDGDPVVATLHSHAARLLRENPAAVQGRRFRFLLDHEEKVMLYDIAPRVPQFLTDSERVKELNRLESMWAEQRTLDDARFAGAVNEWLVFHGGMHVGEVVFLATNAIQAGALPIAGFKHVFVDEYQDLTECEQTFVDLLVAADGSIVVLGDDDQSIYGFRFNHPEGLSAFPQDELRRATVEPIPLPDNHRCARQIVTLANEIAAYVGSAKEPMVPARPEEGIVEFVEWESLDDEIAGLAEVISTRLAARADNTILVLVTRQFMGYRLKALIGDDAVTTFREQVLSVEFVRERFTLASLLADEDDAVAIRAWLALHHTKPSQATHRNVGAYRSATESGRYGSDLLAGIADASVKLQGDGKENIEARAIQFLAFKRDFPADLVAGIELLFDSALVNTMPGRHAPANESPEDRRTRERLEQQDRDKARGDFDLLRRSAIALVETLDEPSLASVIDTLRYRIGTLAPLLEDDHQPRVRIMTLHGAKGLEEESVIVCGLAHEMIPGPPKRDRLENLAHGREQQRLLYVAATRAKNELILSWSDCIQSADTYANGIVQNPRGWARNGAYVTRLTRSQLLPPRRERPISGDVWKRRHLQ